MLVVSLSVMGVITPIGPFCPFRSAACAIGGAMDVRMARMTSAVGPAFATEIARLNLKVSMGREPQRESVLRLAEELSAAHD